MAGGCSLDSLVIIIIFFFFFFLGGGEGGMGKEQKEVRLKKGKYVFSIFNHT